jgi:phage gp29-like protein
LYVGIGEDGLGGNEIEIAPGDGRWVVFTPFGDNYPWLRGAWRGISRWWLVKQYARDDLARHSEVHGSPWRVATNPEGDSKYDRRKIASDIQQMGRDGSLSLPAGWDVKLVEATARTWEMFVAQNKLANDGITIALASQNLTTEVSGGSLAAAEVHFEVRSDIRRGVDESLATCTHEQSLEQWAEKNFGDRHVAPWVTHDTDPTEDTKQIAATWKTGGEALASLDKAGVPVDKIAAAEKLGIPVLKGVKPTPTSAEKPEQNDAGDNTPNDNDTDSNEDEETDEATT